MGDENDKLLIARMMLPRDIGGIEINLIGGMAITPGKNSCIEEFLVYSTKSYGKNNKRSRFDCVQVAYNDEDAHSVENDSRDGEETTLYEHDPNKPFTQVMSMLSTVCSCTTHLCSLLFTLCTIILPYVLLRLPYVLGTCHTLHHGLSQYR
jgi:hypothetical protein